MSACGGKNGLFIAYGNKKSPKRQLETTLVEYPAVGSMMSRVWNIRIL